MEYSVDIHCHPSIKPFGLAYPCNTNSGNASQRSSLWYKDPPTFLDRVICFILGVPKFSQSNFSALRNGDFKVVVIALNPVEKGFFISRGWTGNFADRLYNFVTGMGKRKIDFIQANPDNFSELDNEYKFYIQLHNTQVDVNGRNRRYRLVKNHSEVISNLAAGSAATNPVDIVSVIISIEGGYVFNNDNRFNIDPAILTANIQTVKNWAYPVFFLTFCHHFWNWLGGHARSLPKSIVGKLIEQTCCMDSGLLPTGKDAIRQLLNNHGERRIHIDIKHMSRRTRREYYELRKNEFPDVPVFVSHGAVNGFPSIYDQTQQSVEDNGLFHGWDINFYDDEILMIQDTSGVFGLQIDQRQIASKKEVRKAKWTLGRRRRIRKWTALVWNQIQYIADLLDKNGKPAWDTVCIGSDFDGIISPLGSYMTSADLKQLRERLVYHAEQYLNNKIFNVSSNRITGQKVTEKIFSENAMNFFAKFFV